MIILVSPYDHSAWNLAAEEYLLQGSGECLLLYVNRPSVVLGRNQDRASEVDEAWCAAHGVAIVRRMSGGGAVYHDEGNLNYCFVGGRQTGRSALDGSFLEPVIEILASLGLSVNKGPRKDLWIGGAKISGTATHVTKTRELHHGTLLYDTDLEALHRALGLDRRPQAVVGGCRCKVASVPSPVTNLRQYLPSDMAAKDFFNIFVQACCRHWQTEVAVWEAPALEAIGHLARERYLSESWNQ